MVALPRTRPSDAAGWPVLAVDQLDRGSVRALLDNRVAAIRRPALLDEATCQESTTRLLASPGWERYNIDGPLTGRLGISQYSYGANRDDYFREAAAAIALRREVVGGLPDPLQLVMAELTQAWDGPVGAAEEDGHPYFLGVFRSGSTIRPHADWGPRDGPGWTIENIVAQLAWNMYYAVPAVGGQLRVYDRSWTPDLEDRARQHLYDYDPEMLVDRPRVEIQLSPGDLVMFSASNVHEVVEAPLDEPRIAVSSFVGERPDGSLILWS